MNMHEMLTKMQDIRNKLLIFLEQDNNVEENHENLYPFFKDLQIHDRYLILVLHLISHIANNHYRGTDFIAKIERILLHLKPEIIKHKYINSVIFHIFKNNKRILLFLIQEQIMIIDQDIFTEMMKKKYKSMNYPEYFSPEIKKFLSNDEIHNRKDDFKKFAEKFSEKLPENFEEKRKAGQNDSYISSIIREDNIEKFIIYVNKNEISLNSGIETSIFETNPFILKINQNNQNDMYLMILSKKDRRHPKLIEYAAFFGSIQIFKYLEKNGVEIESSIWKYAIHSDHPEIISYLEEKKIKPENESYINILIESIKCHHNDIVKYILYNYLNLEDEEKINEILFIKSLKYFNFSFIEFEKFNDSSLFFDLCKYDYCYFVEEFLKNKSIDINQLKHIESDEKSALHFAIEKNNYEIIKILLSNNDININIESCIQKHVSSTTIFYEWSDWETWNSHVLKKITPLIFSIEMGNNDIIKLLINNEKIDINHKCYFTGNTLDLKNDQSSATIQAIYTAVEKENVEIVKLLLSNDELEKNTIINFRYFKKNEDKIVKHDIYRTPLHTAIEKENVEIVKLLLDSGKFDINYQKLYSYYYYDKQLMEISSKEHKLSPLHIAVKINQSKIVKLLLSYDDIDTNLLDPYESYNIVVNDLNALYDLRIKEFDDKFHAICKRNYTDFNNSNEEKTAIFSAIKNSNLEICQILMTSKKIDVNIPYTNYSKSYYLKDDNQEGYNINRIEVKPIFYFAIENYNAEIIKFLLSNDNIDVNCPMTIKSKPCTFEIDDVYNREDGRYKPEEVEITNLVTPLELATNKGNLDILTLLLENDRIDVNKKSERKVVKIEQKETSIQIYSPIYISYKTNNIDALKLFLDHKKLENDAKLHIYKESDEIEKENFGSLSLLFLAFNSDKSEIVDLLLESGKFDININSELKTIFYKKNDPRKIDIKEEEKTLLSQAIGNNDMDKFQLLLSYKNIDPNKISLIVEKNIIFDDNDSCEKYFLSKEITSKNHIESFSLVKKEISPLHQAISMGRIEMIKILLSNDKINANILDEKTCKNYYKDKIGQNTEVKKKMTPLFYAIQSNDIEIVKILLLSNNVDVNCRAFISKVHELKADDIDKENENMDSFGITPFNFALNLSRIEIVKLLLSLKDEKNINTDDKQSIESFEYNIDQ